MTEKHPHPLIVKGNIPFEFHSRVTEGEESFVENAEDAIHYVLSDLHKFGTIVKELSTSARISECTLDGKAVPGCIPQAQYGPLKDLENRLLKIKADLAAQCIERRKAGNACGIRRSIDINTVLKMITDLQQETEENANALLKTVDIGELVKEIDRRGYLVRIRGGNTDAN